MALVLWLACVAGWIFSVCAAVGDHPRAVEVFHTGWLLGVFWIMVHTLGRGVLELLATLV